MDKIALNIGSGERKYDFEGYKTYNIDIRPETEPDICADLSDLPFEEGSVDMVFSSHVLEHVGRNDIRDVIKAWRGVLKINGRLVLIVPDLEIACIEVLSGMTNPNTWDIIYGAQNYPENFHKSGFTKAALMALLEHCGFDIEDCIVADRQIICKTRKTEEVFHA